MDKDSLENALQKARVVRSRRKTLSVTVTQAGEVLVRAPYGIKNAEIQSFLGQHLDWIARHLEKAAQTAEKAEAETALGLTELRALAEKAMQFIPPRVRLYADMLGVGYGRITIRNQKSRWGSCSAKGNLNFNCLLMLAPPEVIDYVVVHELCHRREMNHSPRFWQMVESILPDYRTQKKWLREQGAVLMARMRNGSAQR